MPSIKAWSKDAERIFDRLCRDGIAYTKDEKIPRVFGQHCKSLVDNDFLDIAHIKKKRKTIIIKPPQVVIFPKIDGKGLHFEKLRL